MVAPEGVDIVEVGAEGVAILELRTDLGILTVIGQFQQQGGMLIASGVHIQGWPPASWA